MSRLGKRPIPLQEGVSVRVEENRVIVSGPKGELAMQLPAGITVVQTDNVVSVQRAANTSDSATFGRVRSYVANMVGGVAKGWSKTLEIVGTGYRASTDGKVLTLALGFSHPLTFEAPEGISFQVSQNKVTVSGVDKEAVGKLAAIIRKVRPADPYKLKGIRYEGEIIRKKQGKAAKGATGGTQ